MVKAALISLPIGSLRQGRSFEVHAGNRRSKQSSGSVTQRGNARRPLCVSVVARRRPTPVAPCFLFDNIATLAPRSKRCNIHAATRTPGGLLPLSQSSLEESIRMLSEFRNEPLTDFSKPENKAAMEAALAKVGAELGREYPVVIDGERITGLATFESINPSHKEQVVGTFNKGTKAHVEQAIDAGLRALGSC